MGENSKGCYSPNLAVSSNDRRNLRAIIESPFILVHFGRSRQNHFSRP